MRIHHNFIGALLLLAMTSYVLIDAFTMTNPSKSSHARSNNMITTTTTYAKSTVLFSSSSDEGEESQGDDAPHNEAESDDVGPSDVEVESSVESESSSNTVYQQDETLSVGSAPEDEGDVLLALLQLAARTGRGELATKTEKKQAAEFVSQLEACNPTLEPVNSPKIMGTWELVYSSTQLFRSSPFFMAGRAVCSTEEQADQYAWFCDMHRQALAISNIGPVRQIISTNQLVSEFETKAGAIPFLNDFTPFSYSGGWPVTFDGAIVSSADITPQKHGYAWELYMDTVEIKGSNIPGLRNVLDQGLKLSSRQLGDFLETNLDGYTNPKPIFETTYLSDTIRISRDQDGKVFVYTKVSDSTTPTDYSDIEADLGIPKLLEGINDAITRFNL